MIALALPFGPSERRIKITDWPGRLNVQCTMTKLRLLLNSVPTARGISHLSSLISYRPRPMPHGLLLLELNAAFAKGRLPVLFTIRLLFVSHDRLISRFIYTEYSLHLPDDTDLTV